MQRLYKQNHFRSLDWAAPLFQQFILSGELLFLCKIANLRFSGRNLVVLNNKVLLESA